MVYFTMLSHKIIYIFYCFLLVIPFSASAQFLYPKQKMPQRGLHEKIELFANTLLRVENMVGAAVAVVKNDQVVYSQGFGRRNINSDDRVNNNTLFGIASLTKAFAAATLVKVIEDQKNVTQTTPINNFLDIEFSTEQRTKYANVEDLLSHRMGLPKNNFLRLNLNMTRENIPQYIKQFKQHKDFRTSFIYNSMMYGLATYITEKLTKKTWEDVVTEKILRPLKMFDTTFSTRSDKNKTNIAIPYIEDDKGFIRIPASFKRKWGRIGGSGAIQTSANDMSKWMKFLLNGNTSFLCNLFGTRNFGIQTTTVFRRPEMPVSYSDDQYALGWKKGYYRGYPIIEHTGSNWGNNMLLTLFPQEKLGIFVALTGSDSQVFKRVLLMQYVADLYLGVNPWINATSIKDFKPPKYEPTCSNTLKEKMGNIIIKNPNILNFDGTYNNPLWGNVYVRFDKSSRRLLFTYGFVTFQLFPKNRMLSSYKARGVGEMRFLELSSVYFEICSRRGVVSITIPSFEKLMPPTFVKIN